MSDILNCLEFSRLEFSVSICEEDYFMRAI
jgi:hypothetical protein